MLSPYTSGLGTVLGGWVWVRTDPAESLRQKKASFWRAGLQETSGNSESRFLRYMLGANFRLNLFEIETEYTYT